jgi:Ca-dependent carbohydrate-binding module xylan-binding
MWRRILLMALLCITIPAGGLRAEEPKDGATKTSGEIRLPLKDFKFKVPEEQVDLFSFDEDGERLCYYTNGAAETKFNMENDGDYDLILSLAGDSAMDIRPKFKLTIDDKEVGKETSLKSDDIKDYKVPISLKHGKHTLAVAFTNDTYKEAEYDSNLYLHGAKLVRHADTPAKK